MAFKEDSRRQPRCPICQVTLVGDCLHLAANGVCIPGEDAKLSDVCSCCREKYLLCSPGGWTLDIPAFLNEERNYMARISRWPTPLRRSVRKAKDSKRPTLLLVLFILMVSAAALHSVATHNMEGAGGYLLCLILLLMNEWRRDHRLFYWVLDHTPPKPKQCC